MGMEPSFGSECFHPSVHAAASEAQCYAALWLREMHGALGLHGVPGLLRVLGLHRALGLHEVPGLLRVLGLHGLLRLLGVLGLLPAL